MPISTFPRHDDHEDHEDQFLLKPVGLRDTHSEGKVKPFFNKFLETLYRPSQMSGRSRSERIV